MLPARRKSLCSSPEASSSSVTSEYTFEPDKGSKYFTSQGSVRTGDGTFHYYATGDNGPVIVGIHGGGYSGLTWAPFAEEISNLVECRVLAIDLRKHGMTNVESEDLSLELLAKDIVAVVNLLHHEHCPPIILLGHSLGGAVAVAVAPLLPTLVGVAVIDAVEGVAINSLSIMKNVLRNRPTGFTSIEAAVEWCQGRLTSNIKAAKVSMPGQITNAKTGELAAYEVETDVNETTVKSAESTSRVMDAIAETNEERSSSPTKRFKPEYKYDWRVELIKTEKYWIDWYTGLSQKFLDIPQPKILLISSIHGLDTTLTVGQMQGKYQLQVLPQSGHAIHEDSPDQVADIIAQFIVKQKLGKPTPNFKIPNLYTKVLH